MSAAAARLAPSVLREALLDGPLGADPVGESFVRLLDMVGLLASPEFAEWCLEVESDEAGNVLYADVRVSQVARCSYGEGPLQLDEITRRILRIVSVALVNLAAELRELDGQAHTIAVTVVQAFVEHLSAMDGPRLHVEQTGDRHPDLSTAAGRLQADPARLDDVVTVAFQAEEDLTVLRAGQVGALPESEAQRDRMLAYLIAVIRGVPVARVAPTAAVASPVGGVR